MKKQGPDLLWPHRQRCFKCRSYFGFTIVRGLYCCYECAGMEPPSDNVNEAPRQCRMRAPGTDGWVFKTRYRSEAEAAARAPGMRYGYDTSTYLCDYCGTWHNGTNYTTAADIAAGVAGMSPKQILQRAETEAGLW